MISAIGAVIGFSLFAACLTVLDGWRQVSNENEFDKLMELPNLEVRAASPNPSPNLTVPPHCHECGLS